MAGRGRGRGLGIVPPPSPGVADATKSIAIETEPTQEEKITPKQKQQKQQQQQRSPKRFKTPNTVSELATYLHSLNENNLAKFGPAFSEMAIDFVKVSPEKRTSELVSLLYSTVTSSKEHATLGARVCQEVLGSEGNADIRTQIRRELLRSCQTQYRNRESIRRKSIEDWLALFSFIMELFCYLRVGGECVGALGSAVVEATLFTLDQQDLDDDELECICFRLKDIASVLEASEKTRQKFTKSVVPKLRSLAISRNSSERATCMIMEFLELRARGYQDPGGEISDFYVDALTDAIASDEMFYAGVQN